MYGTDLIPQWNAIVFNEDNASSLASCLVNVDSEKLLW